MKLHFSDEPAKEWCNGCKGYHPHYIGKEEEGHPAFKCLNCNRITMWLGGDQEKVVSPGTPPVGV